MHRRERTLIILMILLFISLVFSIINTFRIDKISKTTKNNTNLIIKKESDNRKLNEYFNNVGSLLANNINRTRYSIGLEPTEYPIKNIFQENDEKEKDPEKNNIELYNAVNVLLEVEEKNKRAYILGSFLNKKEFQNFLENTNSHLRKINDLETEIIFDDISYIKISINLNGKIEIVNSKNKIETNDKITPELLKYLNKSFKDTEEASKGIKQFRSKFINFADTFISDTSQIKCTVLDNTLSITNINNSNKIKAKIVNANNDVFVKIDGNTAKYYSFDTFLNEFKKQIREMDLRKEEKIKFEAIKQNFEQRINETEFQKYLHDLSLIIPNLPREDNDYIYYDIQKKNGESIGSFSILKKLGNIYLVDSDEIPVTSLKTLEPKNKQTKNNVPIINDVYSNKESITFILLGNHEKNTDTMIIVHIDKKRNKAFFIGIPRDLYRKGRKINSIYQYYGAEQLKKELTEITGLQITNHIVVDMYAFIDIVNIVGGIEVTLTEDLIDPTYKIRENGVWSTLNYKKGTYNLNGVEALRVARSRHGSNDFERSKRQQAILKAFYHKITELKITDIDKLYKMIHTIFDYIDTDFGIKDVISIYNNYNNLEIEGPFVLSFDNILYNTYSNIYMLDKDIAIDSKIDKGAWILFPKDNDWNNIRWYIRKILNGETE